MKSLLDWLPYILISLILGIVNVISSWQELKKKIQWLPFFKPQKSLGFWIWAAIQFSLPILVFWNLYSCDNKQNIVTLITKGLILGIGFSAIMNNDINIDVPLLKSIQSVYNFLLMYIPYQLIADKEVNCSTLFWADLKKQLESSSTSDLKEGFEHLDGYFALNNRIILSQSEKLEKGYIVKEAQRNKQKKKQVEYAMDLIKSVRHKDLLDTLKKFKCSPELLNKYFSN